MRTVPSRDQLPSRPAPSKALPKFGTPDVPTVLDGANLIDCARVGGAVTSPDGSLACFSVRQYSWTDKKFDNQLWIVDLTAAASLSEHERMAHGHLTQLTAGLQHKFSSASGPQWSPCGKFIAFLSGMLARSHGCRICLISLRLTHAFALLTSETQTAAVTRPTVLPCG